MTLPQPEFFHAVRQLIYEITDTIVALVFSCAVVINGIEKLSHHVRKLKRGKR
jgi:hypothetical protein